MILNCPGCGHPNEVRTKSKDEYRFRCVSCARTNQGIVINVEKKKPKGVLGSTGTAKLGCSGRHKIDKDYQGDGRETVQSE